MMEMNNEVMTNDNVETETEISTNSSNTGLIIGASMLVGGLLTKFVVQPVCGKVKSAWENHKASKAEANNNPAIEVVETEIEDED